MAILTKKNVTKSTPKKMGDGSAAGFSLESLTTFGVSQEFLNTKGPLMLATDLIDEDKCQPRTESNPGFSDESLSELAASIKLRGVKTPISVRENPKNPGRYIINHGARRFRASKRIGNTTIPGFIDNDYSEADQVVENLQRNELTAREIANYIGRELAKGLKKVEIANAISKSPSFIAQHVLLLDLPDPIAEVFNAGRVNDITVINELATALKKNEEEVVAWLSDPNQEITRGTVKQLRKFLDEYEKNKNTKLYDSDYDYTDALLDVDKKTNKVDAKNNLKNLIVRVKHKGRYARLLLNRRSSEGFGWLKYENDEDEVETDLSKVQLIALFEE